MGRVANAPLLSLISLPLVRLVCPSLNNLLKPSGMERKFKAALGVLYDGKLAIRLTRFLPSGSCFVQFHGITSDECGGRNARPPCC